MRVSRKVSLAIAALLLLTSAFWPIAGPAPTADADGGGTFPPQPFNGLQIKYSISGATLGTSKEGGSFDWGLMYSGGATTGNVLTVSGTATSTGCMTELAVSVEGGDARTNPPVFRKGPVQASPNPFNESFSISAPIPPGAMGASFDISLIMRCPGGNNRSIGVSGNFAGPGTRITPTPTVPDCFANIIVPENLKPGDQLAPTAEVFDSSRKPVQAKKIVWQIGGKETNSVVWDGMTTKVLLQVTCPNNRLFTKDLTIPMAAPITITGKIYATDSQLWKPSLPILAVQVGLYQKDKLLSFTFTDEEGSFSLQAPITNGLTISFTLSPAAMTPPPFLVVHGTSLDPVSVKTKPFDLTKDSPNPTKMIISLGGDTSDTVIPGSGVPVSRINDLGAIYYYTYQAWKTAVVRLKQDLDYNLPLYIRAFGSCGASSNWSDPRHFPEYPPHATVCLVEKDSQVNTGWLAYSVFHEFGHHLMADAFDNNYPERGDGSTAHEGFKNPASTDSWAEGFATFFAALVQRETLKIARPEILKIDWQWDMNLDVNYMSWSSGEQMGEEFAVAGLLWDLVDPADQDDSTPMMVALKDSDGSPWPSGIGITLTTPITVERPAVYYADRVQMELGEFWRILTKANGQIDRSPDWAFGSKNIYDVRQLYSVLKDSKAGAETLTSGSLSALDELFIAHGFFADTAPQNLYYDKGEPIGFTNHRTLTVGSVTYPEQGVRRSPAPIPNSYISFDAVDGAGNKVDAAEFKVEVKFDAPYAKYNYEFDSISSKPGLLFFVSPDPRYPVKTYISLADPANKSTEPLVVTNDMYWKGMAKKPQGSFMTYRFEVKKTDNSVVERLTFLAGGQSLPVWLPLGLLGVVAAMGLVGGIWFLRRRRPAHDDYAQLGRQRRPEETGVGQPQDNRYGGPQSVRSQMGVQPAAVRFCGQCGMPVEGGGKFCMKCGAGLM